MLFHSVKSRLRALTSHLSYICWSIDRFPDNDQVLTVNECNLIEHERLVFLEYLVECDILLNIILLNHIGSEAKRKMNHTDPDYIKKMQTHN